MLNVKSFTFNPIQENTYILYNEKKDCCIIDPGCYFSAEEDELKAFIEQQELRPVLLLNTHCHLDHVFGNNFINRTWGLPLWIHQNEKQVLDFAPLSGQNFQLPFEEYTGDICYLLPGQQLMIGADALLILATPGHSPGSVSFYCAKDDFVISGDALFKESIGRTDLPGGNFDTLKESIVTNLYTLPPTCTVYPGHGGHTTIGHEIVFNPYVKE